jgi:hypothetical protein
MFLQTTLNHAFHHERIFTEVYVSTIKAFLENKSERPDFAHTMIEFLPTHIKLDFMHDFCANFRCYVQRAISLAIMRALSKSVADMTCFIITRWLASVSFDESEILEAWLHHNQTLAARIAAFKWSRPLMNGMLRCTREECIFSFEFSDHLYMDVILEPLLTPRDVFQAMLCIKDGFRFLQEPVVRMKGYAVAGEDWRLELQESGLITCKTRNPGMFDMIFTSGSVAFFFGDSGNCLKKQLQTLRGNFNI